VCAGLSGVLVNAGSNEIVGEKDWINEFLSVTLKDMYAAGQE